MKLGKVVGTIVSTRKDEKIEGLKLYLIQDLSLELAPQSTFVVAADVMNAGVGEVVLYATGSSARQTQQTDARPIDAVVMAIVDILEVGGTVRYQKNPAPGQG
jgi:microcompartment protein CcmK/EutM